MYVKHTDLFIINMQSMYPLHTQNISYDPKLDHNDNIKTISSVNRNKTKLNRWSFDKDEIRLFMVVCRFLCFLTGILKWTLFLQRFAL